MQTVISNDSHSSGIPAVIKYGKIHTKTQADKMVKSILHDLDHLSQAEKGVMYGKPFVSARKTVQIADPGVKNYKYKSAGSSQVYSWDICPTIKKEKTRIEKKLGIKFNFVLVNIYTPDAYLGYHADDEKDMVDNSIIGSSSYGAERDFLVKEKKTKVVTKILLESGSLVTMEGSCQKLYKHSIPKRKNVSGIRINLTWRQMLMEKQEMLPPVATPGLPLATPGQGWRSCNVKELKLKCKEKGIKKYSKLKKQELIKLLEK